MLSSKESRRIVLFLIIGLINTGFGIGVYWLLLYLGFSYQIASAISLIIGIIFSFKNHGFFVFKVPGRFIRYVIVWGIIYIFNITFIGIIHGSIGDFLAGLALLPANIMMGYGLMKYFVFIEENPGS